MDHRLPSESPQPHLGGVREDRLVSGWHQAGINIAITRRGPSPKLGLCPDKKLQNRNLGCNVGNPPRQGQSGSELSASKLLKLNDLSILPLSAPTLEIPSQDKILWVEAGSTTSPGLTWNHRGLIWSRGVRMATGEGILLTENINFSPCGSGQTLEKALEQGSAG